MPERSFFGLNNRTVQGLLFIVFGVVLLILNNHDIVPFEPHSWLLWSFLGFVAIGLFHIFVRPLAVRAGMLACWFCYSVWGSWLVSP